MASNGLTEVSANECRLQLPALPVGGNAHAAEGVGCPGKVAFGEFGFSAGYRIFHRRRWRWRRLRLRTPGEDNQQA